MNWKGFLKTWEGVKLENIWLRGFIGGLMAIMFVMVILLFRKDQVVVINPFTLSEEAWVTKSDSSQSYQQAWGMALSMLLGNVTPKNIDYIKEALEPILAPAIFHDVIDVLEVQAQDIKKDRVTMRFEQRAAIFEEGTVFIEGTSYVKGASAPEKGSPRTYEFRFNIEDFRLELAYMDTYEGRAKTKDIAMREQERLEREQARGR